MSKKTMPQSRKQRGQAAEEAAAHYLTLEGYKIIQKNFRIRLGEVDIIAKDGDTLVFIEVRSRHSDWLYTPEETVNFAKQTKLRRLAEVYLSYNHCWDMICRFDVVAVIIDLTGQVKSIELIKDAF